MIYDLHTHSNASDGILSPAALVSRAKERGVTHLALTDHDTVQGLPEATSQAQLEGITLITGIEFSCIWAGRGIHVVGLNVNLHCPELQRVIAEQQAARDSRAIEIGQRLQKVGVLNAYEGAQALAGNAVVGRPHFARYLVEKGYVNNINSAFKQYLGAGKLGDVKHRWPEIMAVVKTILAAGGVPVLAHPAKYDLTRTKLRELVASFQTAGGLAIEVVSGQQLTNETLALADIAQTYNLYASCGSDFHIPDNPWQELGNHSPLPSQCRPVWQFWQ